MKGSKNFFYGPFGCFWTAIKRIGSGGVKFVPTTMHGSISTDNKKIFSTFRQMRYSPLLQSEQDHYGVFVVRFHFSSFSQQVNRLLSLIPIMFILGYPGFREKIWMSDQETGEWMGVYQWASIEAIESYRNSFVLGMMIKRAKPESIHFEVYSNKLIGDFINERKV